MEKRKEEGGDAEGDPFVGESVHEIAQDVAAEYHFFAEGDEEHESKADKKTGWLPDDVGPFEVAA